MTAETFATRTDVDTALQVIVECEGDLGYKLSEGQRRDLICDTFPSWPWPYVANVVSSIDAAWYKSHTPHRPGDAP